MRHFPLFVLFAGGLSAQTLSISSGNGQIVQEQFLSAAPLVVQALDAAGRPAAGVAVSWAFTQGSGTLVSPSSATDPNGLASTLVLATNVPPGASFVPSAITATVGASSVSFVLTTSIARLSNGGLAAPPLVELLSPGPSNRAVSGTAGSVVAGAVVVRVTAQSGFQSGQPVPNVGVRILPGSLAGSATASCNAPNGLVLTDAAGIASCDLLVGSQTGSAQVTARVGEIQDTPAFSLIVTPGPVCAYAVSPATQAFGPGVGNGAVSIAAGSGCSWTLASSVAWITLAQASGSGSQTVGFSVASNPGPARTGTVSVAGQTVTVNQAGVAAPGPLTVVTGAALPVATLGSGYTANLEASGGSGQYVWSLSGAPPPGLVFSPSGFISGTPAAVGSFSFGGTVTDPQSGASVSQTFTLTVLAQAPGLSITTASLPGGIVGQPYQQTLTSSAGCTTPFTPTPVFRLAGGSLPPGLSLVQAQNQTYQILGTPTANGTYAFSVTVTDACGAAAGANLSITIGTAPSSVLTVSPVSLRFTSQVGSGALPAVQAISLASASPAPFTVAASSAANWLVVSGATAGTTPSTVTVAVQNISQLGVGTYNGAVVVNSTGNSPVTVPVTLTITAQPPQIATDVTVVTATLPNAGNTVSQQVVALSAGGQAAPFTAAAATANGSAWLSVSPNAGSTPAGITVVFNAAGLSAGTYSGTISISSAGGTVALPAILTVTAGPSLSAAPSALSFSYSSGVLPATQAISVSTNSSVNFTALVSTASGGNWLSVDSGYSHLAPSTVTVKADPLNLPAGTYAGLIAIQPASPPIPTIFIPVTFQVAPAPPTVLSVTNGASFVPGPVAPGELVTLFGTILATQPVVGAIAAQLGDTRVLFDEIAAPLIYVYPSQIAAVVPFELAGRATTVLQVEYRGVRSAPLTLRVADAVPAIFTADGTGQGAILNQDGTVNSVSNGAAANSVIILYGTGAGQTFPAGVDGQIAAPPVLPKPLLPVQVSIDGQLAAVSYAGAAPGLVAGAIQVNATVPAGTRTGAQVPVILTVGSQSGPPVLLTTK